MSNTPYRIERAYDRNQLAWELLHVGEGVKGRFYDVALAYDVVDLLNGLKPNVANATQKTQAPKKPSKGK